MIPGDLCCSQFVLVLSQTTEKHLLVIAVLSPVVFVFVNMNIWKVMKSYVRHTKRCTENITLLKENIVLN